MEKKGTVIGVSGPVVTVRTDVPASMFEVARVGEEGLLGEVIRVDEFSVRIQVYEDTNGLASGAPVFFENDLLSVDLGPGLLGGVFDGIGRPLGVLGKEGIFLPKGARLDSITGNRTYSYTPSVSPGDILSPGDIMGRSGRIPPSGTLSWSRRTRKGAGRHGALRRENIRPGNRW